MQIPNELLQMINTKIKILHEAIEKDDNPEQQIYYRTMVAISTLANGKRFQLNLELCIDEDYFLEDGDIEIITDAIYKPEPYKIIPPDS